MSGSGVPDGSGEREPDSVQMQESGVDRQLSPTSRMAR